jgi:hypothetical protein
MKVKPIIAALLLVVLLTTTAYAKTIDAVSYDLRTVSKLTAEELAPMMHPESRHLADEVIEICAKEGISAEFIATVMRWERRPDLHNWFGWTNNRGRLMRFGSDVQCLETIIPRIKAMYLTEGGRYFNGYTVAAVSRCYNNSAFWRNTIERGMMRIVEAAR